jgi:hypothetical protein
MLKSNSIIRVRYPDAQYGRPFVPVTQRQGNIQSKMQKEKVNEAPYTSFRGCCEDILP